MCSICGVYVLDHRNIPDVAALLGNWGITGKKAKQLAENSAAAIVLNFLLDHGNNRGHDSSGMVTFDGKDYHVKREMGFAREVFSHDDPEQHAESLEELAGNMGIGHDRYATSGLPWQENIQPFIPIVADGTPITISHNGNIVNQDQLAKEIIRNGNMPLTSTTDSELIRNSIALSYDNNTGIEKIITRALKEERDFLGSYSVTGIIGEDIIAFRDPRGYWPLHMARLGSLVIFNSEETPIKKLIEKTGYTLNSSDFIRSVGKGELELVANGSLSTHTDVFAKEKQKRLRRCAFDFSYLLSYEDSKAKGLRRAVGKALWEEFGVPGNKEDYLIAPIPNSGVFFARGFSKASGVRYESIIRIKPEYRKNPHKTFQDRTQEERLNSAARKYQFRRSYEGIKAVLTDDSLVRGTTLGYVIKEMRTRGIEEIHLRIGTPAIQTPCKLGIHTPTREELIAYRLGVDEEKIERYFECIFRGVGYEKNLLVSRINQGDSVDKIVKASVEDKNNFLTKKGKEPINGKFSLKYIGMEKFKEAFERSGLGSDGKCYACMMPDWKGYPSAFRPYLKNPKKTA